MACSACEQQFDRLGLITGEQLTGLAFREKSLKLPIPYLVSPNWCATYIPSMLLSAWVIWQTCVYYGLKLTQQAEHVQHKKSGVRSVPVQACCAGKYGTLKIEMPLSKGLTRSDDLCHFTCPLDAVERMSRESRQVLHHSYWKSLSIPWYSQTKRLLQHNCKLFWSLSNGKFYLFFSIVRDVEVF